jgi:RNA polymerase sigma factor (sigma-70 family)
MPVGDAWTSPGSRAWASSREEGAWEPRDSRDFYAAADDRMWLRSALTNLPERLQWILQMYYVEELPQRVIAEQIGVSQMQVSRLLARSLVLLRSQAS